MQVFRLNPLFTLTLSIQYSFFLFILNRVVYTALQHPVSFDLYLTLCFIGLYSIHLYCYKCTFRRLKTFRHFYHRLLWIHPGKRAPQYRKLNACLEAKRPAFPFILQSTIFTIFLKYFSNSCKLCYNGKNTWPKGRFAQYILILHRR